MIKYCFPKNIEDLKGVFSPEQCQHCLFMAAYENEMFLGAIRFHYQAPLFTIDAIAWHQKDFNREVFDGLIRSLLYHGAEMMCDSCDVMQPLEAIFQDYFCSYGFKKDGRVLKLNHFPDRFFNHSCCGGNHA
ncbi:MAG: hypothetical protein PHI94_04660 [Eubacteriaceae bacterium]|nr:hypothetical protein [Eubacteriaceae bacterium]